MERMATRGFGAMSQSCASVCNLEKPAVLSLMPHQNFGAIESQKPLISNPHAHYFSTTVPQMVENTVQT